MPRLIHAICTYHGQWLPGDERGFRSRAHRLHSSDDYKSPPPDDEHAGLRRHAESLSAARFYLYAEHYAVVGAAFVMRLFKVDCPVRVLSCGATHVHVLYTSTTTDALIELGGAKQYSSLKLPGHDGTMWAEGGKIVEVKSASHEENVFNYICDHAKKEGAWIWRFDRDPIPRREVRKRRSRT